MEPDNIINLTNVRNTGVKNKVNKFEHTRYLLEVAKNLLKVAKEAATLEMEYRDELMRKNRKLYNDNYRLRTKNRDLKALLKLNNVEYEGI